MSSSAPIKDPAQALRFLLAGKAHVTFRSHKTDAHFTYYVQARKVGGSGQPTLHFVRVLTRPDYYEYLGVIRGGVFYTHGRASKISPVAPSAKAFPWVWQRLTAGRVPETCDVYHEGKCGRCGRRLTVPESITSGLGPECARAVAS